jgi:predicted TIM-barrel fold metal-dependent hydrolase
MLVVDARTHIGRSRNSTSEIAVEDLIEQMDRNGIDVSVLHALPSACTLLHYEAEHQRVIELIQKFPTRIFGMVCIPPQIGRGTYIRDARRYVEEHGFVSLKYHCLFHGGSIQQPEAHVVYEAGRELGVPVTVHTGPGIPWSSPSLLIPIAQQYPDVSFIAAHSGGWLLSNEAIVAAQQCDNVFLDSSWQYPPTLSKFLSALGAERVMLASDFPANLPMQRTLWDEMDLGEEDRALSLGGLAIKIFGLEHRIEAG